MQRTAAIVIGIMLCGIIAAYAYPAPSPSEIAACTGDAFRLCIPQTGFDRTAIFLCLRASKRSMSAGCRAVFERHGL